jgi:hypothetical protein
MASYSSTRAVHNTLVATTVDTVTLTAQYNRVEILNRSASGDIFVTLDGSTPSVGGNDTYVIPATGVGTFVNPNWTNEPPISTVVKLISSGTPSYSVTGQ